MSRIASVVQWERWMDERAKVARVPRVWLIGEANPYQSGPRPEFDLYPHPPQSAGARLCRILGYEQEEYLATFERRNLLYGTKWSAPAARDAATQLRRQEVGSGDALVLCGARVAAAFGIVFEPLARLRRLAGPTGAHVCICLVIPHPSGLSRAWNDPTMAPRVREAVRALLPGAPVPGDRKSGRRRRYPEGAGS